MFSSISRYFAVSRNTPIDLAQLRPLHHPHRLDSRATQRRRRMMTQIVDNPNSLRGGRRRRDIEAPVSGGITVTKETRKARNQIVGQGETQRAQFNENAANLGTRCSRPMLAFHNIMGAILLIECTSAFVMNVVSTESTPTTS